MEHKSYVKNAADEKQVKKADQKVESKKDKELNEMRLVLNSRQGRSFMWRWLEKCGVYKTCFTGDNTTFFNEGQRNIGLMLLSEIMEASPEAYLEMIKENRGEELNGRRKH